MINKFNEIADLAGVARIKSAFDTNNNNQDCCNVYLSSCCGSTGNDETMFCGDCKDHCDFTNEHGFTREEMKTKVTDKNGNILTEAEVEEIKLLAECK